MLSRILDSTRARPGAHRRWRGASHLQQRELEEGLGNGNHPVGGRVGVVFGPLNGVRVALVVAAALAALLALVFGQWVMGLALGAGVAFHGLGWWYLYRRNRSGAPISNP